MYLQNPQALVEHVRMQREEMAREIQHSRLAGRHAAQPALFQRLLGSAGAALVRLGGGLQRLAGQAPAQPIRI